MHDHEYPPDSSVETLLEVQLKVDTNGHLNYEHEHDRGSESLVDIGGELAALVLMAEDVAQDSEDGSGRL